MVQEQLEQPAEFQEQSKGGKGKGSKGKSKKVAAVEFEAPVATAAPVKTEWMKAAIQEAEQKGNSANQAVLGRQNKMEELKAQLSSIERKKPS